MKNWVSLIASLLFCASILVTIPAVLADEIGITVPYEEAAPTEDEVLPAFWDPQTDEIND